MAGYVDGFLLPIPKNKIEEYQRISRRAGKVWRDHGALEYRECVLDDNNLKFGVPFPRAARSKRNETAIFSWIVYKSRAHRDRVNARVMKDPRLSTMDSKACRSTSSGWPTAASR